jgi:hypothetical protein
MRSRLATEDDLPALTAVMALAIEELQRGFLSPEQIAASRAVMGLDTQLVADSRPSTFMIPGSSTGTSRCRSRTRFTSS